MRITRVRAKTSAECRSAVSYLDFLSNEHLVQLAMLADAGDELDILVRVFDTEGVDPSTMVDRDRRDWHRSPVCAAEQTCRDPHGRC